ncbi:transposase [Streptomyces albogriseolus]|uniref:transposase n=1 Tax=Streptomyces albogriseolus TaxID=1887 RepID=UPI003CE73C22
MPRATKGAANTPAGLKSIRAARPNGASIYVILDNLSAHKGSDIRRWAKKNRLKLCFTPTYTSRADLIEAYFGPLGSSRSPTPAPEPPRADPGTARLPAPAQRPCPPP